MGIIAVPNPNHEGGSAVTRSFRTGGVKHADSFSVARVRPRTSKGITDLLLLTVTRLDAACPSKKSCDGRESQGAKGELTATTTTPPRQRHPIHDPRGNRKQGTAPKRRSRRHNQPLIPSTSNPQFFNSKPATYLAG